MAIRSRFPFIAAALLFCAARVQAAVDVKGIDISHWQGTINWTSVKNAGNKFAFMKATQGNTYVDPTFATNIAGATGQGLYVGPYHFCDLNTDTTNANDPINEANHFLDIIKPYYKSGLYLPPVADVEGFPSSPTQAFVSTWVQSFSNTIYNALGVRPIIYGSKSKVNSLYTSSVAGSHELWLAWWKGTGTTSPPVASDTPLWGIWQFWQYADNTTQPGISGNVDGDVYYGTLDQLKNLRFGKDDAKAGDFNRDGLVNTADYNLWSSTNGSIVPIYSGADGNGNAKVDSGDYSIWLANSVPEPGSWALLLIGIFVVIAAIRAPCRRHGRGRRRSLVAVPVRVTR